MQITGTVSVIHALNAQGGVYMVGRMVPIWAAVLVELFLPMGWNALWEVPVLFSLPAVILNLEKPIRLSSRVRSSVRL